MQIIITLIKQYYPIKYSLLYKSEKYIYIIHYKLQSDNLAYLEQKNVKSMKYPY